MRGPRNALEHVLRADRVRREESGVARGQRDADLVSGLAQTGDERDAGGGVADPIEAHEQNAHDQVLRRNCRSSSSV